MMRSLPAFLAGGVLAAAGFYLLPGAAGAFSMLGGSLGLSATGVGYQRDVRVFANGSDPEAHDNLVPNPSYPGVTGLALAVWKGAAAWNSNVPAAGKNFDMDWQGFNSSGGGTKGNTVSWTSSGSCGGGVLAYTQPSPLQNGWRIKFCEAGFTWSDGPGAISGSHYDIEAVMAHEYGHALGLGHTGLGCSGCGDIPTMCSYICNGQIEQRSVAPDDAAGLEHIYGAIPPNKPVITSLSGSFAAGGTLLVHGTAFAPTVNVKFTAGTSVDISIPGTIYGVASSGGGTLVALVVPAQAQTGNVLVWDPSLARLSNPFPFTLGVSPWVDLGGGTAGSNGAPLLSMTGPLTPSSSMGLDLFQGAPNALAVVFVSLGSSPVPFLGGTLYAFPIAEQVVVATDGAGELHGSAFFPGGASGAQLVLQLALTDPSVPVFLASLSNASQGTVP